jgi:AcrR family transcriptional regulator
MTARAEAVDATRERILQATFELWLTDAYEEVTLERVGEAAGVSKQTVIRQFGSKEALVAAVAEWHQPREKDERSAAVGDVEGALHRLIARYESIGDANLRLLQVEHRVPTIRRILQAARQGHREWIEQVFAPFLPRRKGKARELRVMAFYAATDVTLWKLLRRDFGLGREETEAVIRELVEGLLSRAPGSARTAGRRGDERT